jgi:hypothetical protein
MAQRARNISGTVVGFKYKRSVLKEILISLDRVGGARTAMPHQNALRSSYLMHSRLTGS